MLKEFVSFEIAKLAYEKGFDVTCIGYVDEDSYFSTRIKVTNTKLQKWAKSYREKYKCSLPEFYAAPTPLVLVNWITETKGILIDIHGWEKQPTMEKTISIVLNSLPTINTQINGYGI